MGGPAAGAVWRDLYRDGVEELGAQHEVRWMVEEASGARWPAAGDEPVTERGARRFADLLARRRTGEPLQYVLGWWGFRRLDLMVDRRVLIPRPETEQVVEVALAELDGVVAARDGGERSPVVVDLGTGSGAIALSVAAERSGVSVWATDISGPALEVAGSNLAGLAGFAATRVRLAEGSWWSALPPELRGAVDVAVSNPPYVTSQEMNDLDPQVRDWEPALALEAGPEGLEAITEILAGAPAWLRPGGVAVVEIAPKQARRAVEAALASGFAAAHVAEDLAGRPRVLVARQPAASGGAGY